MANVLKEYIAFTQKLQRGLDRDLDDYAADYPCPTPFDGKIGWHTNMGVTYKMWEDKHGKGEDERFFAMNDDEWWEIYKTLHWDTVKGDSFLSKHVAVFVTDMAVGSGAYRAACILQTALNKLGQKLAVDGQIGDKTIEAANAADERKLYDRLAVERELFYRSVAKRDANSAKLLKGWLNKLADHKKMFRP